MIFGHSTFAQAQVLKSCAIRGKLKTRNKSEATDRKAPIWGFGDRAQDLRLAVHKLPALPGICPPHSRAAIICVPERGYSALPSGDHLPYS